MAKDPDERYESCGALVAAAAQALQLQPDRRTTRSRLIPLLATIAVALLLALGAYAVTRDEAGPPAPTGALVRVDPRTNEAVGGHAFEPVAARLVAPQNAPTKVRHPQSVWSDRQLTRMASDALTGHREPRDLAAFGDKVYVGADGRFLSGVVSRYDAASGVREDGIDLLACAMASGEGVLWAAGCPAVQRLSTDSGRLRKLVEVFLPFQAPATVENSRVQFREIAVGAGSLWVLGDALDRRMWRLDRRTGRVQATIELGFAPTSVAVAGDTVWITDGVRDRGVPLAARGNRLLPGVGVGRGPGGIASGAAAIWVTNTLDGTLSRIDTRTRRVVATIDVGGTPRGVAVGAGSVWVTEHGS